MQLAQPLPPLPGTFLCGERKVAGIFPLLAKVVAADFAVNGEAVAAELLGNLQSSVPWRSAGGRSYVRRSSRASCR